MSTPTTPESSSAADQTRWFTEEVYPHDSSLKAYLRGAFPTVRDVDDVVQESYVRVWKAKAVQPVQFAKAFLFQVAKNLALDFRRREKNSPVHGVTDLAALCVIDDKPGVADQISAREEAALLAQALHALPPRCRQIVILRKLKRVPQKEIAHLLGISEQTVQNQVFRGVRRCELFLAERGVRRFFGHENKS